MGHDKGQAQVSTGNQWISKVNDKDKLQMQLKN